MKSFLAIELNYEEECLNYLMEWTSKYNRGDDLKYVESVSKLITQVYSSLQYYISYKISVHPDKFWYVKIYVSRDTCGEICSQDTLYPNGFTYIWDK